MDFRKVVQAGAVFVFCCSAFSLVSCGNKADNDNVTVNKEVIDSLNKRVQVFAEATQEQRETLFRILMDLDEVSNDAFALGKERQLNGQVKDVRMVDHIKARLATIKTELDEAEKKMIENPQLLATINDLKQKVKEQEKYIQHLRQSITIKKSDLRKQYEQLEAIKDELDQKIEESKKVGEDLDNQNIQLSEVIRTAWISAGDKLVASAEEVNLVKNSGPLVKRTRKAKKRILNRAIENYREAEKLGDTSAKGKISQTESKIQNL